MVSINSVILFLLTFSSRHSILSSDSPYDFGLFENEPLLKKFLIEDQDFHEKVKELNERYSDASLERYVETQTVIIDEEDRIIVFYYAKVRVGPPQK